MGGQQELEVAVARVMAGQGPEDERGFVLLDRELLDAVLDPRMPRRRERAVGVVFVEEVSALGHVLGAEPEEAFDQLRIARVAERGRDQRAVPRPAVRVGIAGVGEDVRVVRGEDRAVFVELRLHDVQAAAIEPEMLRGERRGRRRLGGRAHPRASVHSRAIDPRGRAVPDDLVLDREDVLIALAEHHPRVERRFAAGREIQGHRERRIDRALGDRMAVELLALLGLPRRAAAVEVLAGAGGPLADPGAAAVLDVQQHVAAALVVDDGPGLRVQVGRDRGVAFQKIEIVVEEDADPTRPVLQIDGLDPAHERGFQVVDGVRRPKLDPGRLGNGGHGRDGGVLFVAEVDLPAVVADPRSPPVHPDSEAGRPTHRVVFEAHVGEIQLTEPVTGVEGDEQGPVAEGEIAGHVSSVYRPLGAVVARPARPGRFAGRSGAAAATSASGRRPAHAGPRPGRAKLR